MNIVAGRTTGTMEVTQSVQRWVLNSNHLKLYVLSGDPRFLGVHQGPGQRPLHPKRRIPRPQTWRYVVSMCSALAAGWSTSCLTLFLGCDSICVVTHLLSHFRQCWRAQLQGWWLQQHTKRPYRLRKAGDKIFKSFHFSGQLGRGDDSTG